METLYIQGRCLAPEQLAWLGQLISERPNWGRYRLSVHIAEQWDWRNARGQLKDMAARTLLSKLERRGLLQLPKGQGGGGSRPAQPPAPAPLELVSQPLMEMALSQLLPLKLTLVDSSGQRQELAQLLSQHHYLGYRRAVGENVAYMAGDQKARALACLVFGAAAWKCAPRDHYIGWRAATREGHLHLLANNMRFLILPWGRVTSLASHLLSLAAKRLSADWQSKYGHPIYLLETFVQRDRFWGGCYRAANWICLGQTQGRGRNDRQGSLQVPVKDVYVYALHRHFRRALQSQSPVAEPPQGGPTLFNPTASVARSLNPPSLGLIRPDRGSAHL